VQGAVDDEAVVYSVEASRSAPPEASVANSAGGHDQTSVAADRARDRHHLVSRLRDQHDSRAIRGPASDHHRRLLAAKARNPVRRATRAVPTNHEESEIGMTRKEGVWYSNDWKATHIEDREFKALGWELGEQAIAALRDCTATPGPTVRPGRRVRIVAPFSEVCMHMRVAGQQMDAVLLEHTDGERRWYSAQLYQPGSLTPFSFPITPGEAGILDGNDGFYTDY
jgi:hypothetical protein